MRIERIAVALFSLTFFSCRAAVEVNLPPPTEWNPLPDAPTAPGDAFAATFAGVTVAQSPVIAEGNETALPDESFTLAGARFTLRGGDRAGSDCVVWLWADTPAGGELPSSRVWHVEDSLLTATAPAGLPYGMYLVWVENQHDHEHIPSPGFCGRCRIGSGRRTGNRPHLPGLPRREPPTHHRGTLRPGAHGGVGVGTALR